MQNSTVCPYYGRNEDACDVGCGYITSHDAKMIIKFCSAQFDNCQKYQELSSRSDNHGKPVGHAPIKHPDAFPESAALPVFGLFSLGYTSATYALDQIPMFQMNLHALALVLVLGAIGQIGSGLSTLKKNPLRAVAFTAFGLFWLSMLALDVLPRAGFGQIPGQLPIAGYLTMWGLFSLILCQGLESLSKTCRIVFAMLTAFLLMLAVGHVTGISAAFHAAALLGLASGLPGTYLGLRYCWLEATHAIQLEMSGSNKVR